MPPEQHTAGFMQLRWRQADTKGGLRRETGVPKTQLIGVAIVGTPKGLEQAINPWPRVRDRGPRWRGDAKRHRLRPIRIGQTPEGGCRQVQGLVPTDALPTRVGITLGPGAPHRVQEPLWVIDQFRDGAPLGTQGLAGRMGRVWFDGDEL